MAVIDEMAAIPMDGSEVEYVSENREVAPGEYFFRITAMKRIQEEARGSMPAHTNVKFKLELETADGPAGVVWDNLRMYQKWLWKYSDLAKCIGHTAPDATRIRIDWSKFIGATGRVKLSMRDWKKSDGTVEKVPDCKYLAAPRQEEMAF